MAEDVVPRKGIAPTPLRWSQRGAAEPQPSGPGVVAIEPSSSDTLQSDAQRLERGGQGHQAAASSTPTREVLRKLVHELSQPLSGISINTALIQRLLASSAEHDPKLAHLLRELDRDVRETRRIVARSRHLLAPAEV